MEVGDLPVGRQTGGRGEPGSNVVKSISDEGEGGPAIYPLLIAMFPDRESDLRGRPNRGARDGFSNHAEKVRRISDPDYFPIYFRCEVPEATFSAAEMRLLFEEIRAAPSNAERMAIFGRRFQTFEPNSIRRYDFIHKVGNGLENPSIKIEIAQSIAFAISANSETLGNDFMAGEMRRAVAAVLQVAQRLANSSAINGFLADCIEIAKTDAFAADLYRGMTLERDINRVITNFDYVQNSEISAAFAARMDRRYGSEADLANIQIGSVETFPFSLWAKIGTAEQDREISFWLRYVGGSRRDWQRRSTLSFRLVSCGKTTRGCKTDCVSDVLLVK